MAPFLATGIYRQTRDVAIRVGRGRAEYAVIGRDGRPSDVLYTLGSTMRGVLWEVIAVPEIRVQAERLARLLVIGNFW